MSNIWGTCQGKPRLLTEIADLLKQVGDPLLRGMGEFLASDKTGRGQVYDSIALLDYLCAVASLVKAKKWTEVTFEDSDHFFLEAKGARHPVYEEVVEHLWYGRNAQHYVPNDLEIGTDGHTGVRLNGMNFAGKTVHAKLFALIPTIALATGFAPAQSVRMSIPDRISTWFVQAPSGHETDLSSFRTELDFQIELLANATSRSLVVIDQIGGNAIDPDGPAIAMAVFERLIRNGVRTVMVSHHELCSSVDVPGTARFHPEVVDDGSDLRTTYRMVPGPETERWAFQTAQKAGLPPEVLARARQLLGR